MDVFKKNIYIFNLFEKESFSNAVVVDVWRRLPHVSRVFSEFLAKNRNCFVSPFLCLTVAMIRRCGGTSFRFIRQRIIDQTIHLVYLVTTMFSVCFLLNLA